VTSKVPYAPDHATPPGETLRQVLDDLHLTQLDLAQRTGLSTKHVNQIVKGTAPLSQETALSLERVTGVPAGFWNRLEAGYREKLLRREHAPLDADERDWLRHLPTRVLQENGHLPDTSNPTALFHAALAFFGVANLAAWKRLWAQPVASFKRTTAYSSHYESVASWIRIGELESQLHAAESFDKDGFRAALQHARALTRKSDFLAELQRLCAAHGVVVVYIAEIGKCRVSGATWWATPTRAVIALSDRYKTEDQFWFSFFHEAGHVLLHSKKETHIDDGSADPELEDAANKFAANTLIPLREHRRLRDLDSIQDVQRFAADIGVGDGIVVGRLQHQGLWDWSKGASLKKRFELQKRHNS
jgi:HTH-type transcriptional regulator/antitoxin HigA